MANKKNFKKCVAVTAVIGTVLAAFAAFAAKLHIKKKQETLEASENEDFDTIDFNKIDNDTPRDYISIQINHTDED